MQVPDMNEDNAEGKGVRVNERTVLSLQVVVLVVMLAVWLVRLDAKVEAAVKSIEDLSHKIDLLGAK
jgi:hypothetical protein